MSARERRASHLRYARTERPLVLSCRKRLVLYHAAGPEPPAAERACGLASRLHRRVSRTVPERRRRIVPSSWTWEPRKQRESASLQGAGSCLMVRGENMRPGMVGTGSPGSGWSTGVGARRAAFLFGESAAGQEEGCRHIAGAWWDRTCLLVSAAGYLTQGTLPLQRECRGAGHPGAQGAVYASSLRARHCTKVSHLILETLL